jgi:CheY-like chemotaxis protein
MEKNKKMGESTSKALLDNALIYQSLFSYFPDFAYVLDKHCALIAYNQNFVNFLKLTELEDNTPGGLYRVMTRTGIWSEKQVLEIKARDIEVILSGTECINEVGLPIIGKDKSTHHYEVSRIPLFDEDNAVIALLVVIKDVTEKLADKEQLEKLKAQLQHFNANATTCLSVPAPTETKELDHTLKILVVEDNVIAQKAAQSVLMQIDCSVDVANSEAQLNSLFKPGKYDIVFMDIGLEETSGYMLARKIRELENNAPHHVPIIALTGYKADMLTTDCAYYQMEGAITKPLTIEQAQQLIQRYIFKIDIEVLGLQLASQPVVSTD